MVNNKGKPWHKRLFAKVTALAAAVCMMLLPVTAHADMQGIDVSNWQCGIDIASTQADFVVVGTTWARDRCTTTVSCPASTRTPTA